MATTENSTLLEIVKTLTPQQADALMALIRYLKEKRFWSSPMGTPNYFGCLRKIERWLRDHVTQLR